MRLPLIILMAAAAVCTTQAQDKRPGGAGPTFRVVEFKGANGQTLHYSLFVPADLKADEKLPLVLCLHGRRGNTEAADVLVTAAAQAKHRAIVMAPGIDGGRERWTAIPGREGQRSVMPELLAALDVVLQDHHADAQRVYVTGQSMGGVGTWGLIASHPERFAAAVPVCGVWRPEDAEKMKSVPVWAFHGADDPTVPVTGSQRMIEALKAAGVEPRYTEYPGVGHNSWSRAYATEEMWDWLFSQRRAKPSGG